MLPISKTTYFYTPLAYKAASLPEVTIIFETLTLGQLTSLDTLYNSGNRREYLFRVCYFSVRKIETINQDELRISDLPLDIVTDVAEEILKKSTLNQEDINKATKCLSIYFSETLSADTWKCDICRLKRLDNTRNCGYLGQQDKNLDFKIIVNKELYTHCPIYELDTNVVASAIDAYNILKGRFLPSPGGWYDQTQTFTFLSILTNNVIEERNRIQMDKALKETKKK